MPCLIQREKRAIYHHGCHLRCLCGDNFFGKTDSFKKGRSYYECSGDHHSFGADRCDFRPRIIRAPKLEELVWTEVVNVLSNPDYLKSLAAEYLAATEQPDDTDATLRRDINRQLSELQRQKTNIIRKLASIDGGLDALEDAIKEIESEEQALTRQADLLDERSRLRLERDSLERRLVEMAEIARERLADPTSE